MNNQFEKIIKYIKETGHNPYSDKAINQSDLFYINTLKSHYEILFDEIKQIQYVSNINALLELGSYMSVGCHIARDLKVNNVTSSDMYQLDTNSNYKKWLLNKKINYQHYDLTLHPETSHQEKYDCIIFQETLEHIPSNPARTLLNVNQMLKNNGYLIFSVPNFYSLRSIINLFKFTHPYVKKEEFLDIDSVTEKSGVHWIEFDTKLITAILGFCNFEIVDYKKNNINYGSSKKYKIKNLINKILSPVFDQHRFILKKAKPYSEYLKTRKKVHAEHEAMNL
tara:strand:+ start:1526 stop:2368 length:843 start_codon:yes stop_codon:yes gene_type:complete